MLKRLTVLAVLLVCPSLAFSQNERWNHAGLDGIPNRATHPPGGPAPRRDLTGIWDAGRAGIGARGRSAGPLTAWGEEVISTHKPGDGPRMVPVAEINDPLSIMADPAGFPRNLLFELRPIQIIHTPNQVVVLHMWEKRWRVIWTDGRELPQEPAPRWYGYSVGTWEDDYTFVVRSNGTDERTWLDNAGHPHSDQLRVEERYHRLSENMMELTVIIDDPKAYKEPWVALDRLLLVQLPPDTDLAEMIPSASEAAKYRSMFALPSE